MNHSVAQLVAAVMIIWIACVFGYAYGKVNDKKWYRVISSVTVVAAVIALLVAFGASTKTPQILAALWP